MKLTAYISLLLIPTFVLLAYALRFPVAVGTDAVDEGGRIVLGSDGESVLAYSAWLTWKANWLPNVLLILAVALLLYVLFYVVFECRAKHLPRGGRHGTA
jgi:hypothetical protein